MSMRHHVEGPCSCETVSSGEKTSSAGERVAKVIARAGVCSRRDAERMIADGRVTVNGSVLTSPVLNVMYGDVITIDGRPLQRAERTRLWRYHKPTGTITAMRDPGGRPTVFDRLPSGMPRVMSVGRLDFNTEGLLLLTNDGELERYLELPQNAWLRRYKVRVRGTVDRKKLEPLKGGVTIAGIRYGPINIEIERDGKGNDHWLIVSIREGKNREVRNIMAFLGLKVMRLIRVEYGPFVLGDLPPGGIEEVSQGLLHSCLRGFFGERGP